MKTRTKILLLMVPIVLIAVAYLRITASATAADPRRQGTTLVKTEIPKRETIVQSLELTGDVLAIQQAQVFARVYGNLESIEADMGNYVHENQLLARIDTTELAQQYRQTAATYQNSVSQFDRTKSLIDQNLASKQDFDNAETAMKVAAANFDAAKTRLDYAQINAPFSGFITRRFLDPGALVSATNATLFNLMDLDKIKIIVNVLEKDVPLAVVGSKAAVTVDAYPGRKFEGVISRSSQALDLNTRTLPVEIDVDNADHSLKPGMFARVALTIGQHENALTIPSQAVLKDAKGAYVYVADKGVAHRKSVTTGAERQSRVEILTGLAENENVITTGQQFAKDGGTINVQP